MHAGRAKIPSLALGGAEEIIAPEPNPRQPGHDEPRIEHPCVQWREGQIWLRSNATWRGGRSKRTCPPPQTGPFPVLVLACPIGLTALEWLALGTATPVMDRANWCYSVVLS